MQMNRRSLLLRAGLAGGGLVLGTGVLANPASQGLLPAAFGSAPELQPLRGWLDGMDRIAEGLRVQGRLPAALRGTLYRNGPGLLERAGQRYRHWFDGDGLVQAWRFGPEGVSHQARFVQTRKFRAEQQAGEFLLPAFGTAIPPRAPVRGPDDLNTANTSVTVQGGRLYALWEGGSATELDPFSLRTLGPKTWAPELAGMPFSAHPKREPDGTLWNFGTFAGKLALYQIGADGRLLRQQVLDLAQAPMVHDFAVTQRFLVFLLPPLRLDMAAVRAGASMAGSLRWDEGAPNRVLVIDKATLQPLAQLEASAELLFHFGNAWDDGQGQIRLDYVSTDRAHFLDGDFNRMLQGHEASPVTPAQPRLMHIDLPGRRVRVQARREQVEFPQVDPRVVGQRYRYLYYPEALEASWGHGAVLRLDLQRERHDRFDFGRGVIVEEQLLVPKPGSRREGEGWLIGTGFDAGRQRSFCSVFDAEAISAGPLATVWLPYWAPLGFHGHFQTV